NDMATFRLYSLEGLMRKLNLQYFGHLMQKTDSLENTPMLGKIEGGRQYTALTYSFPDLEPVCCSMSSSNCCFLTCIWISQEAGQVVWYSHLLKNFPQFAVIHPLNKTEIDVFSGTLLLF
ncbi:hypothetical protein ACWIVX_12425, partial [Enterobacter asburiae]